MGELVPLLGNWFWWVAAGVLLILELAAPGVFFIWLAIPATAVGLIDFAFDLGWQAELLLFAGLSLISLFVGKRFLGRRHVLDSELPNLNRRMFDFVGKSYVLQEPIVEGRGRLVIASTQWDVTGPDAPRGARVRIIGVDGLKLKVELA
ncbi:MAG: NfeD family protein [Rhizobiales bacterium]|nr:NfeD family protein [Hyphomicrobiales bacterium]MBI3672392.1 NfeD family protein [Hyphomicrobiales bacterium]